MDATHVFARLPKTPYEHATARTLIGSLIRHGFLDASAGPGDLPPALAEYQAFHGLQAHGQADAVTVRHLSIPRTCCHPDRMALTAGPEPNRWPDLDVQWDVAPGATFGKLAAGDVLAALAWAWGRWASVCGVRPARAARPEDADVMVYTQTFAPSLLAWTDLPDPGKPGPRKGGPQRSQRFNDAEAWCIAHPQPAPPLSYDLCEVALHEVGHALGLGHKAPAEARAIMNPTYSRAVLDVQPDDAAEAATRYGPPPKG
jgi:hypothetical protein